MLSGRECWHVSQSLSSPFVHSQPLWQDHFHVSQSDVQPLALDFRSPAPQQANITSAIFVTPDNQFTKGQLPAPSSPEYQPIRELTYQYLQFCAVMSTWTSEKLQACAL